MALAAVSLQWGKFFHDAILMIPTMDADVGVSRVKASVWAEQGIYAAVSFSYALDSQVLLPSKDAVLLAFAATAMAGKASSDCASASSPAVLIRDNMFGGVDCPLGIASLVAGSHLLELYNVPIWSLYCRTLFSRMCEAIAGNKHIRYGPTTDVAKATSNDVATTQKPVEAEAVASDPGVFEESYRLLLGELQLLLRHRLQVEWPKLTLEDKMKVLKTAGIQEVLLMLNQIVDRYLSQFNRFNMTSWCEQLSLLHRALMIANYGIASIKSDLINFIGVDALVSNVLASPMLCGNALPVFYHTKSGTIAMREMTISDVEEIVMFIDAIVATKAAPKVIFKPILNPSHPIVNSRDPKLRVTFQNTALDLKLPMITISFIGNVNSGKSSIVGRTLLEMGLVTGNVVQMLAAEAERVGLSASTRYAWIVDNSSLERGKGKRLQSDSLELHI